MLKRKRIRAKGKIPLSKYFQSFEVGDSVALVKELGSQGPGFPDRVQGKTGKVVSKKGRAYVVEVYDYDMKKQFSVRPVHLKRIMEAKQ